LEINIKNRKRGIALLIISSLAASSIWLLFNYSIRGYYIHGDDSTAPIEYYKKSLSNSDAGTLKQLIREFYSSYQGLYNIGNKIAQDNLANIQIKNRTLVNLANDKAKCNDITNNKTQCTNSVGPTYGLDNNTEIKMRKIINNTIPDFKNRYNNNHHEYSFIATPDCNMYLLEPYNKQQKLVSGNYSTHPWCIELKDNPFGGRAYATETYLTKNQLVPWSTIAFPIDTKLNETSQKEEFFGLGLNLYQMTLDFFKNHNLPSDNTTKLFLIATHTGKTNSVNISEPGYKYPGRFIPIENTPLTTLNKQEQTTLKQEVDNYDKNGGIAKNIKIAGKPYYISATTNNIQVTDNQNNLLDTHYPITDNRDRGVSWEWVLLRESPSNSNPYSTNEAIIQPSSIFTIACLIGIGVILILYINIKRKTLKLLG